MLPAMYPSERTGGRRWQSGLTLFGAVSAFVLATLAVAEPAYGQ